MENITKDYVFLDGVWLKQEKLLEMASQAGSMAVAEHYLCAYLTNALMNGNREAIKNLNAIRKVYNLEAIPFTEEDRDNGNSPKDDTDDKARKKYLEMSEEIKKAEKKGNDLGLNAEEKAFYDALSTPEGVKEAYTSEQFVALTKALTEGLRKNRKIDWNKKTSARAKMRLMVKKLLKIHKYPPEGQEQALETVMAQCEQWADNEDNLQ